MHTKPFRKLKPAWNLLPFSITHVPLCPNMPYVFPHFVDIDFFYVLTAIFVIFFYRWKEALKKQREKTLRIERERKGERRRVSHVKRKSRIWFNLRAKTNYRLVTYITRDRWGITAPDVRVAMGASTLTPGGSLREADGGGKRSLSTHFSAN